MLKTVTKEIDTGKKNKPIVKDPLFHSNWPEILANNICSWGSDFTTFLNNRIVDFLSAYFIPV